MRRGSDSLGGRYSKLLREQLWIDEGHNPEFKGRRDSELLRDAALNCLRNEALNWWRDVVLNWRGDATLSCWETRLWIVTRRGSESFGGRDSGLLRDAALIRLEGATLKTWLWIDEGTQSWIDGRMQPWIVKDAVHILLRERSLWFMKGRGLQNAALEASHAVYRDAKISLDHSRQCRHWRLRMRVVGTSHNKNPRVIFRLDLRFTSQIKAINWPLRMVLIFMSLINGHSEPINKPWVS